MKRGQVVSFRLPSDTPDHVLNYLEKLKKTESRNFSSNVAELVIKGIRCSSDGEVIIIPITQQLTKDQREWLKHDHSLALLGNILCQIISEPTQSTPKVEVQRPIQDSLEDDDLSSFEWDFSKQNEIVEETKKEDDAELLGGFLDRMNR